MFLEVMRTAATLSAARDLRLDQSTVARRVDRLERALGLQLFDRLATGYRPTARAVELLALARSVGHAAEEVAFQAGQWRRQVHGRVRVTATETVANLILAPLIAELAASYPDLIIELVAEDRRADILRGEADAAVRIGPRPDQDGLILRRLPDSVWTVCASSAYLERHGRPETAADLAGHLIVLGSGHLSDNGALLRLAAMAPEARIAGRMNSISALAAAVREGLGISSLPQVVLAEMPSVLPVLGVEGRQAAPVWLVHHQSQRARPELRLFLDAVAERFDALRSRLRGPD